MQKTVRTIRARKDLPWELYNNSFSKNQRGHCWQTVNILSCSFLPDALRERCSLKPCPPDISLSWQFTVMSKVVPATPEHASLAQCPEWVSLPRRACLLWRPLGLSRQLNIFFSSGTCNQVTPFLPVRAKDSPNNSNKERLAMGTI